jgi:DNA-binding MarR family transcriptional regulator
MTENTKATRGIKKIDRLFASVRSGIGETIPVQVAHTFIIVARQGSVTTNELAALVGSTPSTVSRHLLDLSGTLRSGAPGYGLLNRAQDPTNLRVVHYTLTAKGKLLLNQLVDIVED